MQAHADGTDIETRRAGERERRDIDRQMKQHIVAQEERGEFTIARNTDVIVYGSQKSGMNRDDSDCGTIIRNE